MQHQRVVRTCSDDIDAAGPVNGSCDAISELMVPMAAVFMSPSSMLCCAVEVTVEICAVSCADSVLTAALAVAFVICRSDIMKQIGCTTNAK